GEDGAVVVFLDGVVAEGEDFVEVVAGVDVDEGEGDGGGPEGFAGEVEEQGGVFAAGEQDGGAVEFAGDFAEDVDRLGLQRGEVVHGQGGSAGHGDCLCGHACNPHSVLARPAQRPLRGSAPGNGLAVQGA